MPRLHAPSCPPSVLLALASLALGAGLPACSDRAPDGPPPTDVVVARELAAANFAEERYDDSRAAMREVLESRFATAQDFVNAACLEIAHAVKMMDPAERRAADERAAGHIAEALERQPDSARAWFCRGVLARRHLEYDVALESFEKVLATHPEDPASRLLYGLSLADTDRRDEAEAEYRFVLDRGIEFGGSYYLAGVYRLGQLLLRSKDPARVEEGRDLIARFKRLEAEGIKSPSVDELDRGFLGQITIPAPASRTGDAATATPAFEARPLDLFGDLGALSEVVAWDVDDDGDLDLLAVGDGGAAVAWQGENREYAEERLADGAWRRVIPTDLDNDGLASVLLLGEDRTTLRTRVEDAWRDDTATLPAPARGALADAAFVDFEHEGDLDLLVATGEGLALCRNLGAEHPAPVTFEDATAAAAMPTGAFAWIVLLDHDHDHDVDFLVGGPDAPTLVLSNLRKGRFEVRDGAATGLPPNVAAALRGDLDHDGRTDLVLSGAPATFLRNRGDGTFEDASALTAGWDGSPAALRDVDGNGELDLVTGAPGGGTAIAFGTLLTDPWLAIDLPGRLPPAGRPLAEDLDGDGDLDLVLAAPDGGVVLQRQGGPPPTHVIRLHLQGRKDNRPAVGAIVEMRAGELYTHRFAERPDLRLGLGAADRPDVLRVTWPNGVVQYAIRPAAGAPIEMVQKEGLSGSCPFLYTWDGSTWSFIGDVLGATPLGLPMAPGAYVPPNHEELVRIAGDRLAPKDGAYELAITEELREATYLDRAELWVVDHAEDVEIHPEERFCFPPFPPKTIHAVKGATPVAKAIGSDGNDWTDALARQDEEHAVPFEPLAAQFQGLATPHWLELTLPDAVRDAARVRLLMTGWFYWTDASVNIAAAQHDGVEFVPPTLSVPDGAGGWRETGPPVGFPTGKTKTMVFDVGDLLNRDDPRLRIASTLRLYWDCVRVAVDDGDHPFSVTKLDAASAELRSRGFSEKLPRLRAQDPEWFDYTRTMPAPWNQHRGMLTRFGDVLPLLDAIDDRFVVFSAGDEVRL
ncbi:MAG: FG-GAP-like repeat-containing protein, partial [Planctomycetota bacterium JB042]